MKSQLIADKGVARPNLNIPPDDSRRPGQLRRSTEKEREHRDRGNASDSDAWKKHQGQERD